MHSSEFSGNGSPFGNIPNYASYPPPPPSYNSQALESPSMLSVLGMTAFAALSNNEIKKPIQDYSDDAARFFDAIRTPASLIAAASLSVLFTEEWLKGRLTGVGGVIAEGQSVPYSKGIRFDSILTKTYQILTFSSFLFSIATVLLATSAGIGIMDGNFNPYASSPYMLLTREFEFELLSSRLGFFFSLFSFIIGVTIRFTLEFNILNKQRETIFVLFGTLSLISHLTSYVNSTLICYNSLWHMCLTWIRVSEYVFCLLQIKE